MVIIMDNNSRIVSLMLDLGEIMLVSGGEVNRVEDTLKRIGQAYGCTRTDVFTITSSIVLTVRTADDSIITQTRRISGFDTDFAKVEKANQLSRRICSAPPDIDMFAAGIEEVRAVKRYPEWVMIAAYALVSAAFTVFFGGGLLDALASAVNGVILRFLLVFGRKIQMQTIVLTFFTSIFVSMAAYLMVYAGLGTLPDKIMIGNIMLLIPGIAMTSSLRDMFTGDLISGLLGMAEAILRALAIAAGFAVSIVLLGRGA